MATIRASCPDCGDVELTTGDVAVRICTANNQGSYSFRCPGCRLAVAKDAPTRVVDLLVSSGVRMTMWELPGELHEPRSGRPISHDDLLDFHALLAGDDWFERLAAMVGR